MAWGGGVGACCVPCELVSKQLPSFGAERHQGEKPIYHVPKMISRILLVCFSCDLEDVLLSLLVVQ